jgi:uncharacterized phage protein gp47/JayE
MAGLTSSGLEIKRLADIKEDLSAACVAQFGPSTRTGPDSVLGQLIGVFAMELAPVWELAQQLYDSFDPDQAEGTQLDNLSALIGVTRLPATFSTGTVTLTGTAATIVPSGSVVEVDATGDRFVTVASATIGLGGTVDVAIQGQSTGPVEALATTIDTIVTPVAGWSSVTNAADISPGTNTETDGALRIRREESLQITGASVDLAIRSALRQIAGVEQALVVSNRSALEPDANGLPAHSFESVVWPNTGLPSFGQTIAETIFRLQPAGIEAFGSTEYTVTDSEGYAQIVAFSFATEIQMYVVATISTNSNFPADGNDQVAAALLAEGNVLSVGDDVVVWRFIAALDSIPGITDVSVAIDSTVGPTNTLNIPVDFRSVATFDSTRITV